MYWSKARTSAATSTVVHRAAPYVFPRESFDVLSGVVLKCITRMLSGYYIERTDT